MSEEQINLHVTTAAREYILSVMQRTDGAKAFRLGVKTSGCSGYGYQPEVIKDISSEDSAIEIDSALTVYIPTDKKDMLNNTTIDLEDKGLGQSVLVYNNPNVTSECGCGESFSVKPVDQEDGE